MNLIKTRKREGVLSMVPKPPTFFKRCMDIVTRFRKEVAENKFAWVDMGFKELDSAFLDEVGGLSGEEMADVRFTQKIILKDFIMQRYNKSAEDVPLEAIEIILGGIGKETSQPATFHWDGEKAVNFLAKLSQRQSFFKDLTKTAFPEADIFWGDNESDDENDDEISYEDSASDKYESSGINDASEEETVSPSSEEEPDADDDVTDEEDDTVSSEEEEEEEEPPTLQKNKKRKIGK
jgi:hypothetical protein